MSVYCQQCSHELLGVDQEDLAGFVSPAMAAEGYALYAVCEACGPVMVDADGRRLDFALREAA